MQQQVMVWQTINTELKRFKEAKYAQRLLHRLCTTVANISMQTIVYLSGVLTPYLKLLTSTQAWVHKVPSLVVQYCACTMEAVIAKKRTRRSRERITFWMSFRLVEDLTVKSAI